MRGRLLPIAAMLAAALLGAAFVSLLWLRATPPDPSAIGGPFTLVDTSGRTVTEQSLKGKPTAMFFGFTYCPEVCPTTLAEMTAALQALGKDADKLNVVFVTVDPERDTPEQMKLYLSSFDPRIQGFTGEPSAAWAAAKAYRIYFKKVPLEGGSYTMDHSTAVYLLDKQARFVGVIRYGAPHAEVVDRLRRLVAGRALD